MGNLLEIRDLTVGFRTPRGRVHALRNVAIDVPKGQILGIVGESGSGKSTVAWASMGLLADNAVVERGRIAFEGHDLLALEESQLAAYRGERISMVFQDPVGAQIPLLTYGRQMADIQYRRRDRGAAEKRAAAARMMHRVGIADPETRLKQYPHAFSGGMRQRAGIAMALLMHPSLLIADEPTTALDVTMEAQIIHLLRELKEEFKATVIVVSHNLGLIAELCDRVVVMYAGEVIEQGDVRQVFYRAHHPYTRALLACDPARVRTRTRRLPTIPGEVPDLTRLPRGCAFASRCPEVLKTCWHTRPMAHAAAPGQSVRCHLRGPRKPAIAGVEAGDDPVTFKAPTAESLLAVDQLRVRFPSMGPVKAALHRIKDPYVDVVLGASLRVRPGETLGLVGESGSGKTTLGRAILGLVPAQAGSVRFDGRELIGLPQAAFKPLRREMAMMFQDPVGSLSPRRRVRALIGEPFEVHRIAGRDPANEVGRLCDMVGLPQDVLPRYPHELSGGQARRVGVARALALRPRLVIADEPTAGLDVSVQGEILNLMSALQRDLGLSYLIITHNLPVVRHVCDRLAIMYMGRLVEQGDCARLFERPAHPYTEALTRGVPLPDPDRRRAMVSIEGEVPSLTNRPPGCEFHSRCRYAQARCRSEVPADRELAPGHRVRCHFPLNLSAAGAPPVRPQAWNSAR